MTRSLLFILIALCFGKNLNGQSLFEKTYPVELSNSLYTNIRLLLLPDSSYVFSSKIYENPDIVMIIGRINKDGNVVWVKQLNDSTEAFASDITVAQDGYLYATYSIASDSSNQYYSVLLKLDVAGNILWSKRYGKPNRREFSKQITPAPNAIFISGDVDADLGAESDIFLIKTDTSGNLVWGKTFDAGGKEYLRKTKLLNGNKILLSGYSQDSLLRQFLYLVKVDANGTFEWNKRFYIPSYKEFSGQAITEDPNHNIILTGRVDSVNEIGKYMKWDIFLMKLASDGTFKWGNIYGGANFDEGYSVFETNDGGFMIGAEPESYGNVSRISLMKTDSLGNVEWIKLYGDTSGCFLDDMVENYDNGYTILATDASWGNYGAMLLIKVDSTGAAFCGQSLVTIPHNSFTPLEDSIITIGILNGGTPFTPLIINYSLEGSDYCDEPTSILSLYGFENYQVYPNPFTSSFTVSIQRENIMTVSLAVRNILGQIVYEVSENNFGNKYQATIDLSALANGIYLLDLTIDGERTTRKITKQ